MPHMFWLAALLLLGRAVDAAAPQPTRCDGWNCHNRVPKTVDPTKQDLLTKPLARVVPWDEPICVNATEAAAVVDLSCSHVWGNEHFHRVYDCLLPNWNLFETALSLDPASLALLVPQALSVFYEELFPEPWQRALLRVESGGCVHVRDDAAVYYENRPAGAAAQVENVARARNHVWAHVGVAPSRSTFVYVERESTVRAFTGATREALRGLLHPGTQFVSYYGNESFADTVRLFSQASVVFYFHGAGVANVVWAPDGSALLEVTLLIDDARTEPWRCSGQQLVDAIPSLRWFLHGIPVSEGVDVRAIEKALGVASIPEASWLGYEGAASSFLQNNQRVISVPKADLTNLAWMANTLSDNRASLWTFGGPTG